MCISNSVTKALFALGAFINHVFKNLDFRALLLPLFCYFLGNFWVIFGYLLSTFWSLFGPFVKNFWSLFGHFLATFGPLFGHFFYFYIDHVVYEWSHFWLSFVGDQRPTSSCLYAQNLAWAPIKLRWIDAFHISLLFVASNGRLYFL